MWPSVAVAAGVPGRQPSAGVWGVPNFSLFP